MTTVPEPRVEGVCDARFAAVREAFAANFVRHGEVGAAVAIALGGRVVVDLWAGHADAARSVPWRRDTLVNVFSVSKALSTICALRALERGLLALDAPVARVWPEFAAAGKDAVTLRQILSHRAGLPAVRAPLPEGAMLDFARMTDALAHQAPWWAPGSAHGYHVNTFGFLLGELVRRATGETIGRVLREEIAGPLGADVHVGLPRAEHGRVAEFIWTAGEPRPPDDPAALPDEVALQWNTYFNPPGVSGSGGWVNTAPVARRRDPVDQRARHRARPRARVRSPRRGRYARRRERPRPGHHRRRHHRALVRRRPRAAAAVALRPRLPAHAARTSARAESQAPSDTSARAVRSASATPTPGSRSAT